jgi:signal peptidase I
VVHGILHINGQAVTRERIADYPSTDPFRRPKAAIHYLETLPGGVKHEIIELDGDTGALDDTQVYTVPPGHYFMMGDNRADSADSRYWGPIPKNWVIGGAFATYWPPNRINIL